MRARADAAILLAASVVFLTLVGAAARELGATYEEVVAYATVPLDVRDAEGGAAAHGAPPRFVVSTQLPRLAFDPIEGVRLPLLNQPYMTDHLSYGGVALAALGFDPLWSARLWHALFGAAALWLLHDIALALGLGRRTALLTAAVAATSLPLTFMYTWARFDESLASFGTAAVLAAGLRHARSGAPRWLWAAVFAAAFAVSGKLTAIWPLSALGAAALVAGWRPPPLSRLVRPGLAAAPLMAPMVGFALAGPATANEVGRRMAFLDSLFTSDVIPGTAANMIDYLGNWGGILSEALRGAEARAPNVLGWALAAATLGWLFARVLAAGPIPRRRRRESQMLVFAGVVFAWVVLFYREHRDYQFALLVPLHAVAVGAFLHWCASRWLDRVVPAWLAGALVCTPALAANGWDQWGLQRDLAAARNAFFDLPAQRSSAQWMLAHGVVHPIVVTFYATGTYELLTDYALRPVYASPLFRHAKDRSFIPDYAAVWRDLLAENAAEERYALLPVGFNPVEAQHFDEPAIRAALQALAGAERVAVFSSARGEALLEMWRIARPPAAANEP